MKRSQWIFQVAILLQLVINAIAGNGIITYNQIDLDEDNVEAILKMENFLNTEDQSQSRFQDVIATHNQTVEYWNTSLSLSSQDGMHYTNPDTLVSLSNWSLASRSQPGEYYLKPMTAGKDKASAAQFEDLSEMLMGEESENELQEMGMLLPINGDTFEHRLSRVRRALYAGSGQSVVKCELSTGDRRVSKEEIATAMEQYLKNRFNVNDMTVQVTDFSAGVVKADIRHNTDEISRKDLARALYELDMNDNFVIKGIRYSVSFPKLQEATSNILKAAKCFLCRNYMECKQDKRGEWFCKIFDSRFYPYGYDQGDTNLRPDDEFYAERIIFDTDIPFGNKLVNNLYVATNGIISFGEKYSPYIPQPCPIRNRNGEDRMIVAPYWCDLDLRSFDYDAKVFTHLYKRTSMYDPRTEAVMNKARDDVRKYSSDISFTPDNVAVFTWQEMPFWPAKINSEERVNFQVIISTNGERSYVMILYGQGAMRANPFLQREVEVCVAGRNLDRSRSSYYIFDQILGNTGYGEPGLWFFPLGNVPNSAAKCQNWFQKQLLIINQIEIWNWNIPPCPCSEFEARISFQWIQSYLAPGCYDIFPMYGTVGRRCCYRSTWWDFDFENRMPWAGNLQMFTPYYGLPYHHEIEDAAPKRWCCYESNFCHLYFYARPARACVFRRTRRAFFFGDPHILTLDGRQFSFNGLGEYRLLEILRKTANESTDFALQGRTCHVKSEDGRLLNATVFCAFALHNTNGTDVHVEISPTGDRMIIYVNKQDYTTRFYNDSTYSNMDNGIHMERVNGSLKISTPDGVGFTVGLNNNLLEFSLEVDEKFLNHTKGLLGNFNDNNGDDFIYPNGTVLPNTTSERGLYEYGQSWSVGTSYFLYTVGKDSSNYSDPTFKPFFWDEANATQQAEATKVCGGTTDMACIYDYFVTGNAALATSTKDAISQFEKDESILSNHAPAISGTVDLNATVNQISTLNFNASDPDMDPIQFVIFAGSPPEFNYTINMDKMEANFKPTNLSLYNIEIAVNDSKGQLSEIQVVKINICSGCSNRGTCDFGSVRQYLGPYFSVVSCDCQEPYSGDDCENDKDGCDNNPCPLHTNCTDVPAAEETTTKIAFKCGACPAGTKQEAQSTKCEDIDECAAPVSPCGDGADCVNTERSYNCPCKAGYRKMNEQCIDIDECMEKQHKCEQICKNLKGSYECECEPGFQLNASSAFKTCIKIAEQDPCKNLQHKNCSYACHNNSGVGQCFCQAGFKLADDEYSCEDIDECVENLCTQGCQNSIGSYECLCNDGYKQHETDKRNCEICPETKYGKGCNFSCDCKGRADTCDNVKGCICNKEWEGFKCEDDVDECNKSNPCPLGQICTNTNGSYTCSCPKGYEYNNTNGNGSCFNIDECARFSSNCSQNSICKDLPGDFLCECIAGYNDVTFNNTCSDINECDLGISGCQQTCKNMQGSFNCECNIGYTLDTDRKRCIQDPGQNLCQTQNKTCEHDCNITSGMCFCHIGYQLASNGLNCTDTNECTDGSHNCTNNCMNTLGSYECSCPNGMKLQNDKRTCEACNQNYWGPNCEFQCACNPLGISKCDSVTGCVCLPGWNGTTCSDDINECNLAVKPCKFSNCTNTPGSYDCNCDKGFELDINDMCIDINECNTIKPCDQICTNTNGSYTCSCQNGFQIDGDKCKDIDECSNSTLNKCNQICSNEQGSFSCGCNVGFILDATDKTTCIACANDRWGPNCVSICSCDPANTVTCDPVTGLCACKPGWMGSTCSNTVDECVKNQTICGNPIVDCKNTAGSSKCPCNDGFVMASDMKCTDNFETIEVQIKINMSESDIKVDYFDNKTEAFRNLAQEVQNNVFAYGRGVIKLALLYVKVTHFINGSIFANTVVGIDKNFSTNPRGDAAKLIYYLKTEYKNVSVKGINLTTESKCDIFNLLSTCPSGEKCDEESVTCKPIKDDQDLRDLIIGLAVGIPLFLLLAIAVALITCLYARRRRKAQAQASSSSVDHEAPFRNMFATRASTKGTWAAPHQLYSPDAYSETGTSNSGDLLQTRPKGRTDFQDSAWYDNKGATPLSVPPSAEASTDTIKPTSNFSWEYMFRLLEPHKDFEIQRPFYETEPNPTYVVHNNDSHSSA